MKSELKTLINERMKKDFQMSGTKEEKYESRQWREKEGRKVER